MSTEQQNGAAQAAPEQRTVDSQIAFREGVMKLEADVRYWQGRCLALAQDLAEREAQIKTLMEGAKQEPVNG